MARLIAYLAFVWVLAVGGSLLVHQFCELNSLSVVGAGRGVRAATSPEKSTVAVRLSCFQKVSSWWPPPSRGDVGTMETRRGPKKGSCTAETHSRDTNHQESWAAISERRTSYVGDPGSKTRMAMLGTRFLLCKFRMKDEERPGDLFRFPRKTDQSI